MVFKLFKKLDRRTKAIQDLIKVNWELRDELDPEVIKGMGSYSYLKGFCTLGFQHERQMGTTTTLKKMIQSGFFGDRKVFINSHSYMAGKNMGYDTLQGAELVSESVEALRKLLTGRGHDSVVFIFTEFNIIDANNRRRNFVDSVYEELARFHRPAQGQDITVLFFSS